MSPSLDEYWLTETLRLRESLWGPLEDASETGRARAAGGDFPTRLFFRSRLLARRENLDGALARWQRAARLVLAFFALAALLAGASAAAGALGGGGRPVNLALALAALLGLNTVTFLMWILSFGLRAGATGSLLADAWLKLTRRLARGPDFALLPRALLELLARQRLTRWSAGAISHALWALALLAALATLVALLAARRYTFQWETTLLSPDVFIGMVQGLGWLPSLLGFPQPSTDVIRASGGTQALPAAAHALWSAWLLGIVVVYGLLPRVIALLLSLIVTRRRLARLRIDASLPGIAELHDRLMPASAAGGIDTPAPRQGEITLPRFSSTHSEPGLHHVLGLELPDDLPWPPPALPPQVGDFGVIDAREQRRAVLDTLRHTPPERLLVACDARQTPDRGMLAQLRELASLAGELRIVLLPSGEATPRRQQWRQQLLRAGFMAEQLPPTTEAALAWLAGDAPDTAAATPPPPPADNGSASA